jgi:hypothetical protein
MKKLLPALALALFASTSFASERTYECSRYVDGKPTGGHINVKASSKSEAEAKALAHYRNELKMRTDSVNCK